MLKLATAIAFSFASFWALAMNGALASDATFDKSAGLYLEGKYQDALSSFGTLAKSDSLNARVHYYLGLCHMRLHEREEAQEEFEWIDSHSKNAALKLIAQTWLNRLERHRKHISDNYSIAQPVVPKKHDPVMQVLWFYTNWCPKCKRFLVPFEQAKETFKGVNFERLNAEAPENWSLVSKFQVKSYPTLVYFDRKGKVIENYAAAPTGDTFNYHLKQLGAQVPKPASTP